MAAADYIGGLEALGYSVEETMPGTLFVEGFGCSSYFPLDDADTLDSMIDPTLHAERVDAYEHPSPPQTPPAPSLDERVDAIEGVLEMDSPA